MKNLIAIILVLFSINFAKAQDETECKKIVLQIYESINKKDSEPLLKHLSDDFSFEGYSGEIAKQIIQQLFSQLNTQISNINKISSEKTDVLTLIYEADFGEIGKKTSTFVFNNKDQLKSMELLKLKVETICRDETRLTENDQEYFTIPFKKVGNLISVEGKLDGINRTFLFDNGAPVLILNSAHFVKDTINKKKLISSNAKGVGGNITNMDIDIIKSFEFGGIKMEAQKVVSMDLSHLEKETKTTFYGLIGYQTFKDYDLLFDYRKNTITFIKPESTKEFLEKNFKSKNRKEVPIQMGSHLAVVDAFINGKKYSFGIDCGAESNLIDLRLKGELISNFRNIKTDSLSGANKEIVETLTGKLNLIEIGGVKFKKTETCFSDISHLNNNYELKLDGLLGYEILSKQPTLISYKNKKIVFLK